MKKLFLFIAFSATVALGFAQQTGYYNGTEGKEGDALKAALNDIISGHTVYSYFYSKEIFKLSDRDPNNPNNVIGVYSGFSRPNSDYGNGPDQLNREHVWAKSHGDFVDWLPMHSDVHNLKPEDASVNQDKSNKDYDNGGIQHDEATECYYTDDTWEPRNSVKGDIARIIFYMSTRYEGENGELDLEVVDQINTYPTPTHGKLSTLLQWNQLDPPDAFERNRNNVIASFQHNRNPFIDNPEFADLIWNNATASAVMIANVEKVPEIPAANSPVLISATITSSSAAITAATIHWGTSYETLDNSLPMSASANDYSVELPGQQEDQTIYYRIEASDGTNENSTVVYNYYIPKVFDGQLISIYDIQGQTDVSPYANQVVSTSGVVTGSFGTSYFIQDGTGLWNGLFVYDAGRNPSVGDSVIITGTIKEYYTKTELADVTDYYFVSENNTLPQPVLVSTGGVLEGHESVLVKVQNATCVNDAYQSDFFMWWVNDGSGVLKIHNTSVFEYDPTLNDAYDITGPMNFDFDEWKIELRFETDVLPGSDLIAPTVLEITPLSFNSIRIDFSEDVEEITAENIANYSINNGIDVVSASQHAFNKKQVNLEVTGMTSGTNYTMNVDNITDLSGNVMEPFEQSFDWVGVGEQNAVKLLSVYPMPTSDYFTAKLVLKNAQTMDISLFDLTGRLVYQHLLTLAAGQNQITIPVHAFDAGTYQLLLQTQESTVTRRVMVY